MRPLKPALIYVVWQLGFYSMLILLSGLFRFLIYLPNEFSGLGLIVTAYVGGVFAIFLLLLFAVLAWYKRGLRDGFILSFISAALINFSLYQA